MVIILILVVLWGLVLAPSAIRKFKRQASHQSIDSFHHSLHLLERSGPKIVEPAYRLVGNSTVTVMDLDTQTARPQLVLLRPPGHGEENPMNDHLDDYRYDAVDDDDQYYRDDESGFRTGATRPSDSYGRRVAARRRRNILVGLLAAVVVTAAAGLMMSFFFVLTAIAAVALVGYVALMSYVAVTSASDAGYRPIEDRHVAHATVWHDAPLWDDASDMGSEDWNQSDAGWWDEPRQAVGR